MKFRATIIGTYITRDIEAENITAAKFIARQWLKGIMFIPAGSRVSVKPL